MARRKTPVLRGGDPVRPSQQRVEVLVRDRQRFFDRAAQLVLIARDVGVEAGFGDDVHGDLRHFGLGVDLRAVSPCVGLRRCEANHNLRVSCDALGVERGRY